MKETRLRLAKQYKENPSAYPEYEKYFKEFEEELKVSEVPKLKKKEN